MAKKSPRAKVRKISKKPAKRAKASKKAVFKPQKPKFRPIGWGDKDHEYGLGHVRRFKDDKGNFRRYARDPKTAITARYSAECVAYIDSVSKNQGDCGRSKALEIIVRDALSAAQGQ